MTIKQVVAFQTSDGSLFYNEAVANAYDMSGQFVKWCEANLKPEWDAGAIAVFILQHWNVSMK